MERIENPMLSYRPEEEEAPCFNCGCDDARNDVETFIFDKKIKDYKDTTVYYCDDCYNDLN